MAPPKDKSETGTSKGILETIVDKATGRGDSKARSMGEAKAEPKKAPNVLGGKNPANREALEAAGYKRGGQVKAPGFRW